MDWKQSMRITLQTKRKLWFVTNTRNKSSFKIEFHEERETCNAIELSQIISTVPKYVLRRIIYASNTNLVWEDIKEIDKINRVHISHLYREIVTIFYSVLILSQHILPTLRKLEQNMMHQCHHQDLDMQTQRIIWCICIDRGYFNSAVD